MVSTLAIVLILIGSVIFGIIMALILFAFYAAVGRWIYQRKIPKDKKMIKKFIEENPSLQDGGRPENNEKEVEENARTEFQEFRQYEKLRRAAIGNADQPESNTPTQESDVIYKGLPDLQGGHSANSITTHTADVRPSNEDPGTAGSGREDRPQPKKTRREFE